MSDTPRRAHERHDLPGHVPGDVTVYSPISIKQISAGGALVEIRLPLQLDSLHDFRLMLGDRSVVVKGRVAHPHINHVKAEGVTYHTGVEFVDLSDAARKAIELYVQGVRQSAPTK